jgi:hypothetical protein
MLRLKVVGVENRVILDKKIDENSQDLKSTEKQKIVD